MPHNTLVIVESPAKAKTIEKYLGAGYTVRASVGHVRDLPKSDKDAIDIAGGFVPHYEIAKGKDKVIHELKQALKKADDVVLATDPDREGEAIAWHLVEALGLGVSHKRGATALPIRRVTFNEITKDAVRDAFEHPREIDQDLRKAQEARRVLDRLVGYELSGLIWKKVRYGLSAGRVQSPALRILMEREREIRAFVPETYWIITATLAANDVTCTFVCTDEPRDRAAVDRILNSGRSGAWSVRSVKEIVQDRHPYPPFTTSTLQQTASTRLGMSPSRTMAAAQKLYEAGHITYMRTDSPMLSQSALPLLGSVVEREFGAAYRETRNFRAKTKNAQEAHEAIRPTDPKRLTAGGTEQEKRLYRLIWTRAVASQMKSARVARTRVAANVADADIPDFAATGSRVLFDGWLKADPAARGEDVELPTFATGQPLSLVNIGDEEKQTTPPPRYSEAGLIKELEKRGIGRPSTYATIMKNLIDKEYADKEGKTLRPTKLGDIVSSFLEANFASYISDSFTALMENELDDIANGARAYVETLSTFYEPFHAEVVAKESIPKLTTLGEVPRTVLCPLCSSSMEYKLGRNSVFMSCSRYPECSGARTEEGALVVPDKPIGVYPENGEPIFILRGKYGPYVQVGDPKAAKVKGKKTKPKRASIPKGVDPDTVTLSDALRYLSLPRLLGTHPLTGETITASVGRFGPYIVHQKDFRSLKEDDVYTITLERALDILKQPKKVGRRRFVRTKTSE